MSGRRRRSQTSSFFFFFTMQNSSVPLDSAASAAVPFGEHRDHPLKGQHTNALGVDDPLFKKRRRAVRPSGHIIRGAITQKALREYLSEETPMLTVEDVHEMCEKVIGLPLLRDHRVGEVLARVVRAWPDEHKRIMVDCEMEDSQPGWRALNDTRSKKRIGFSLGSRYGKRDTEHLASAVEQKIPVELSLTESPEWDEDAWVTEVTENSAEHEELKKYLFGEQQKQEHDAGLSFVGTEGGARVPYKNNAKKNFFHTDSYFFAASASSKEMASTTNTNNTAMEAAASGFSKQPTTLTFDAPPADRSVLNINQTPALDTANAERRALYLAQARAEERAMREAAAAEARREAEAAHAEKAAKAAAAEAERARAEEERKRAEENMSIAERVSRLQRTMEEMQQSILGGGGSGSGEEQQPETVWVAGGAKAHLSAAQANARALAAQKIQNFSKNENNNFSSPPQPPATNETTANAEQDAKMQASLLTENEQLKARLAELEKAKAAPAAAVPDASADKPKEASAALTQEQLMAVLQNFMSAENAKQQQQKSDKKRKSTPVANDDDSEDEAAADKGKEKKANLDALDGIDELTANGKSESQMFKEELRSVMDEYEKRAAELKKRRDTLARHTDRFDRTQDDLDAKQREDRRQALARENAEYESHVQSLKDWLTSRTSKASKSEIEDVRKQLTDFLATMRSKRKITDEFLDSARTNLMHAVASSIKAEKHAKTLQSLHDQIMAERLEKERMRVEKEALEIRYNAHETVAGDDPRNRLRPHQSFTNGGNEQQQSAAKRARTEANGSEVDERFFLLRHSNFGFSQANRDLVAASAALNIAYNQPARQPKLERQDALVAAASSTTTDDAISQINTLVAKKFEPAPEDGFGWIQDAPNMSKVPGYSATRERGSQVWPMRALNGLNNPQTPGQLHLYNLIMDARKSGKKDTTMLHSAVVMDANSDQGRRWMV